MSVDPEIGDGIAMEMACALPCFPLRHGKIQRPLVPDETLRRDRLLDWMASRANRRVIYVVAEAGFGKTTLIADYLRRSQLRTFWYRLDDDDTDGLVFLRYLIAACQAVGTRLLARSAALLAQPSVEPAPPSAVLEMVLGELEALGEMPSTIVLDDFHTIEGVPAIGAIVERLIDHAPARLQFIVASRRTPGLSVALLRARGELAELDREQLRFDEAETGRLFRDAYKHPLAPDVLRDLHVRTDGWAASLQLVKTAVDGRSPDRVRAFIDSLSGSEGDLYDYLAEEVVGDLDPPLREFLVHAAILEDLEPDTAAVAASVPPAQARLLLTEAQRLGLVSRDDDRGGMWRSHPLVRQFLLSHLEAEIGRGGVAAMHRRLAAVMEPHSWRLAARHWAAAGDGEQVRRVVCTATPAIIGTGDLAAAGEFITRFPDDKPNPWFHIIESRQHAAAGRYEEAAASAMQAELARGQLPRPSASLDQARALNRLYLGIYQNDPAMRTAASRELAATGDLELVSIAHAAEIMSESALSGSIDELCAILRTSAVLSRQRGHHRYEGISLSNLSMAEHVRGNDEAAITAGEAALSALGPRGDKNDVAATHMNLARALAHIGRWSEAEEHVNAGICDTPGWLDPEVAADAADVCACYGSEERARRILGGTANRDRRGHAESYIEQVAARLDLQQGRPDLAAEQMPRRPIPPFLPAFSVSLLALDLQIKARGLQTPQDLEEDTEAALNLASKQQAWYWWKQVNLTRALVAAECDLVAYADTLDASDAAHLSIQAELVATRLGDIGSHGFELVRGQVTQRPDRWRETLRRLLGSGQCHPRGVARAVELLEIAGETDDIPLLRSLAKRSSPRLPDAGRGLIRRLAPRVYVEDLGRVSVRVGERVITGTDIRRKVLSLLCFLLSRPQFTATREQVLEALWPEIDPEAGANSLNQSAYFLRRVLEPGTDDDTSAGYLRSRADLIWLDRDLVHSRSTDCLELIGLLRCNSSPELITRLADSYKGRFAVDLMYEDWASSFRENLHASFLALIERALASDTRAGAFDRALHVAQQVLQADPDAEQIELCLLRLYRRTGANAAAAEQYAHYAGVMKNQLGIEPPALESI